MDIYNSFINTLDTDIIELLSIRQKYKLNSKNFKVYELGGYSKDDIFIFNFDKKIELYESNNQNLCYKYVYIKSFNENNQICESFYDKCHNLNLNRFIKQFYITFLYDLCEFGEDSNSDEVCDLDVNILLKITQRINFNYEIIKYKYISNQLFYKVIFKKSSTSEVIYYLSEFIKQPTYLEIIHNIASTNNIQPILIQSLYKFYILPLSIEIQYYFLNNFLNKTL